MLVRYPIVIVQTRSLDYDLHLKQFLLFRDSKRDDYTVKLADMGRACSHQWFNPLSLLFKRSQIKSDINSTKRVVLTLIKLFLQSHIPNHAQDAIDSFEKDLDGIHDLPGIYIQSKALLDTLNL